LRKPILTRFMRRHGIRSLPELQQRSTADIAWFWDAVLDDWGVRVHRPWSKILDLSRSASGGNGLPAALGGGVRRAASLTECLKTKPYDQ
jgi:hypothetical protein